MTENERYCVRAGYWHNYTGIGRCEDENLTTNEVCDLINEQHETITEQASQIDFLKDENRHMRTVLEENQRLKKQLNSEHQMLENAILLERTRMGKNSLIQYKEAIQ